MGHQDVNDITFSLCVPELPLHLCIHPAFDVGQDGIDLFHCLCTNQRLNQRLGLVAGPEQDVELKPEGNILNGIDFYIEKKK